MISDSLSGHQGSPTPCVRHKEQPIISKVVALNTTFESFDLAVTPSVWRALWEPYAYISSIQCCNTFWQLFLSNIIPALFLILKLNICRTSSNKPGNATWVYILSRRYGIDAV